MKVTKHKKIRNYMSFYMNNFGFREPLLILIDGSFCHAAYKIHLQIEEQLKKYFQCEVKLIVTACIITETENLGSGFVGTTQLLKRFLVHRCGHEKRPIVGSACIKSMTFTCRYIVATQDQALKQWILSRPSTPLFYLHNGSVPTLAKPSEAHRQAAEQLQRGLVSVRPLDQSTLTQLKTKEGIVQPDATVEKKWKKRPKNPNPLSCKKPQRKKQESSNGNTKTGVADGGVGKKKNRKRIKVPKHVVEHLKAANGPGTPKAKEGMVQQNATTKKKKNQNNPNPPKNPGQPDTTAKKKKENPKNPNPPSKQEKSNGKPKPAVANGGVGKKKDKKRNDVPKHAVEHLKAANGQQKKSKNVNKN
ncbi:AGAP008325-PA-like protein [Anopheles sinensis]|uniref:rRNA-processing protein UTP23 homolog n=1 Tax=Anopheles sinensis TaxID=74873 RepID=A0A084VEC2_ANOSI|nr:AGAP008325-PA-like protein [Anopheles sinensis]